MTNHYPIGLHFLCEYYDCDLSRFCPAESNVKAELSRIVDILSSRGLSPLGTSDHFFGPSAVSACINLSESHLNFHTWPEFGYVALDVFCCSPRSDLEEILHELISEIGEKVFSAGNQVLNIFRRGEALRNNDRNSRSGDVNILFEQESI
ncbi:MAG TPA: S-adenosylmethionine decarboxylase [Oligoflexia bacterium]|nr:S-adenosylmethionine decarboxylase [Oligoflexia bacterium]HMP49300.1 S-adenosylmethionine decarboxylase [Oligoflexia bacterium]